MKIIISIITAAVLSTEISTYSSLADSIKKLFGLHPTQRETVKIMTKARFWNTFWGLKLMYLLYPITLLLQVTFGIILLLNDLINCSYCLSYHIAWVLLWLYAGQPIVDSLLLAPLSLIIVGLYNRLR
jgi:hypothetical protein